MEYTWEKQVITSTSLLQDVARSVGTYNPEFGARLLRNALKQLNAPNLNEKDNNAQTSNE